MTKLCLLVSRRCNLRCGFCQVEFAERDMGWDTARRAIEHYLTWCPKNAAPRVKFFGGEPLLNWEVLRRVIEAGRSEWKSMDIKFEISTNGSLLDAEKLEYLKSRPEAEVTLSFPVPNGAALPRAWYTLVLDRNCHPKAVLSSLRALLHNGYRWFNFLPVYYVPWTDAEISNLRQSLAAASRLVTGLWWQGQLIRIKNLELTGPIPLYNDAIAVDIDGGIYACNMVQVHGMEKARELLRMGSIYGPPIDLSKRPSTKFIAGLMEEWAGPKIWAITQRVDEILSRFVSELQRFRICQTLPSTLKNRVSAVLQA